MHLIAWPYNPKRAPGSGARNAREDLASLCLACSTWTNKNDAITTVHRPLSRTTHLRFFRIVKEQTANAR